LENTLILEKLCRNSSGLGVALGLSNFVSEVFFRHGTEKQKRTCLKPIIQGKALSGRSDHGSHITMTSTQVVGIAQSAFDRALSCARERQQFGRRIANFHLSGIFRKIYRVDPGQYISRPSLTGFCPF